jgi:hypothetical protein
LLDHPPHRRGFEESFEPQLVDMGEKGPVLLRSTHPCQEDDLE